MFAFFLQVFFNNFVRHCISYTDIIYITTVYKPWKCFKTRGQGHVGGTGLSFHLMFVGFIFRSTAQSLLFLFHFVLNLIWKVVFQDTRCLYPQWQLTRKTSSSVHIPELDDPKEKARYRWNSMDNYFNLNSEITIFPVNQCWLDWYECKCN